MYRLELKKYRLKLGKPLTVSWWLIMPIYPVTKVGSTTLRLAIAMSELSRSGAARSLEGRTLSFPFAEGVQHLLWNTAASTAVTMRLARPWGCASGRWKRQAWRQRRVELGSAIQHMNMLSTLGYWLAMSQLPSPPLAFFCCCCYFFFKNLLSYISEQCRVTDTEAFAYFPAGLLPPSKYA